MPEIGHRRWAIAEGYIPGQSLNQSHALVSHETICLLNAGESDAQVKVTLYFKDRDPVGPYNVTVGARRTLHLRFNDLTDPAPVPRDTAYSSVIESSRRAPPARPADNRSPSRRAVRPPPRPAPIRRLSCARAGATGR